MMTMISPSNAIELREAVRSTPRIIAVGAGTKPRLSAVDAVAICTKHLSGIVEYDPSEFTFTALAGTPVSEIAATLAAKGQYLPFDPMLVDAGATLGGTIASGVSGPGRFRFGGLRDFILGVQFVDGAGRLLRLGGKVVKNAAGFDVPKFMVGGLGRFGVLVETTFKVFPQPASRLTLALDVDDAETVVKIFSEAGNSRWELEALDALPNQQAIVIRLGGPASPLKVIAKEILSRWRGRTLADDEAEALWSDLREFQWVDPDAALIKVALSPGDVIAFYRSLASLPGTKAHLSSGGNMAFVSVAVDQVATFDSQLRSQQLCGVTLRGDAPLWVGARSHSQISRSVKAALDAENRFPGLED